MPKKRKIKGTGTGSTLGQTARAYKAMTLGAVGKSEEADEIWKEWARLSPTITRARVRSKKALNPKITRPPRSR